MKKVFALLLAIAMMATLSVTAFAAEVDQDAQNKTGVTKVTFNVDPTYTVTIPATVVLDKKTADDGTVTYENDYTISADAGVRLKRSEYIEVTVAGDFTMETQEGAWLDYVIFDADGYEVEYDGVVAAFDTDKEAQSTTIHIAADDPQFAGEYSDTVTFTVAVAVSNQPG